MNKKAITYTIRMFFRNMFILAVFCHLFGCMGSLPVQYANENEDKKLLEDANDAFKNKSFVRAEELFSKLYGGAYSNEVRRIALYGLACTRLVLAANDDEFNHAFNLWYSWYNIPSGNISQEDPRMMTSVFEKMISSRWSFDAFSENLIMDDTTEDIMNTEYPANLVETPSEKEFVKENPAMDKNQLPVSGIETSNPGIEIQYLLESREKEILKLRQQLGSMEKNIKSLKNQIHAIEEIHQEIFEKKKGMRLR
jgi:hypothetical protein